MCIQLWVVTLASSVYISVPNLVISLPSRGTRFEWASHNGRFHNLLAIRTGEKQPYTQTWGYLVYVNLLHPFNTTSNGAYHNTGEWVPRLCLDIGLASRGTTWTTFKHSCYTQPLSRQVCGMFLFNCIRNRSLCVCPPMLQRRCNGSLVYPCIPYAHITRFHSARKDYSAHYKVNNRLAWRLPCTVWGIDCTVNACKLTVVTPARSMATFWHLTDFSYMNYAREIYIEQRDCILNHANFV